MPPVGTDMPASKTNGFPIALDSAFNRIVRYSVAANLFEMNEVLAHLPYIISNGLEIELEVCEEVHRYDLDAKRAYYFQLEGERLHIWSWEDVEDYIEAGTLLALVASLDKDLSEELAIEVYERATGRSVNQPRTRLRDKPY